MEGLLMRRIRLSQLDSPGWSLITFGVLLLPAITAIWCVPWFVTQDGPVHLYNAYLISEFLKGHASVRDVYMVQWTPLPNIAGHFLSAALLQIVSPWTADRLMMTLTSVGLASATLWLHGRVAGWQGMVLLSPLAVSLALNVMWLWGFYNFLLGACLFTITLGYWWAHREHLGRGRAVLLAGLVVLGYLCHLISSMLTVFGLIILSLTTPGPGWRARCRWTAVILSPVVPLAIIYHRLMQTAGGLRPNWTGLPGRWSLRGWYQWYQYLEGGTPLTYLDAGALSFVDRTSAWSRSLLLHSSSWVAVGLLFLVIGTLCTRTRRDESPRHMYRGWMILTLVLSLAWVVAPSDFGTAHGEYLRMRVLLLALLALVPLLSPDPKCLPAWVGAAVLGVAAAFQSAIVWDYALTSNRSVSLFMEAQPAVGRGKSIGTLLIATLPRDCCHAVYHADALLGVGTGNIVWNNYEAAKYYFPVQYRDERGPSFVKRFNGPVRMNARDAHERFDQWAHLLIDHHQAIDTFVVWGTHPGLDAMIAQWYGTEPMFQKGNLRVFQHR